ncbi:MAG TPA: PEP/pyruvate-binding domain-containing protein, partial [Vicinamibacteria bacterium]|nr:PEP/pyruvate-binding domain-containing protein [Vicinamibacteria bacterium]
RQEYPHLLAVFKSSRFPTEIVNGLAAALDDLGDKPLIVRSSSLLEDRVGSAFSGKYKSLFLANQGDKQSRLAALLDAVAEVYASVFSPDPIQYRAERGLLEHHEEMGIMIQEVVGSRMGRYYLPAFSGVGFSNNEFRWSPRIKREDGLLRMVPGLGTRAVDRLADDYPVLVAPGQPGLRVNVSPDEVVRYSPRKVDVINMETGSFETVDARRLLEEAGADIPRLELLVSVADRDRVRRPSSLDLLQNPRGLVFTFEGLTASSPFLPRMKSLLTLLKEALGTPVDIEFASDGHDFYLLQCRPQSYTLDAAPTPIPRDIAPDHLIFSAHRYVSNGHVPDLTHVVYVDPDAYTALPSLEAMREVGRAVSALNALLPKRQFLLVGPGRWGSRGDVKLGVSVTYSDINNTAALIEVARKRGNYVPDLSFGTHFFQDLVEAGIRYLPLYPDDPGVLFNEAFLAGSPNVLAHLLPAHAHLAQVVRVIDVPQVTGGDVLRLLMNADLDEAVAFLAPPGAVGPAAALGGFAPRPAEDHWRWRLRMAQRIASDLDPARFGVTALYVFGSTKNATAGPGSDIDLIVHFAGSEAQRQELGLWLQGWSLCLAEMNYLRTGYRSEGLLDVQYVSDEDIARQTSYAVKIGAITDAARLLALGPHGNDHHKDTKDGPLDGR